MENKGKGSEYTNCTIAEPFLAVATVLFLEYSSYSSINCKKEYIRFLKVSVWFKCICWEI